MFATVSSMARLRHVRNAAIGIIVAAMVELPCSVRAQSTSITVVEVPSPQTLVADLRQRSRATTDELLNAITPGMRTFVVIPTRDAAWVAELRSDATSAERQRFVEGAAGVLEAAAAGASVSAGYGQLLVGLQRRLREESGGLVIFNRKVLGARDLVVPTPLAISEPLTVAAAPPNSVLARPPPALVRSSFLRNFAFALVFLMIGSVLISRSRAQRRAENALLQEFILAAPPVVRGGSRRPSPAVRSRFGGAPKTTSASTASITRRSSIGRMRGLAVFAMFAAPAHTIAPQRHDSLPTAVHPEVRRQTDRKALSINRRETAQTGPSRVSGSTRIAVDVSGSIRDRAVAAARQIAAVFISAGQPVELTVFGDSLVRLGEVTSLAKGDSILGAQPRHRRTHLGEAIVAMLDTTVTPHRTRLTVLISDLQPDDAGDESLRYLPDGHVARLSTPVINDQPPPISGVDAMGLGAAASAVALLVGLAIGRRDERRHRPEWIGRNVRIAFRGRAGRTLREVSLRDLTNPLPLFAADVGTRHRPFVIADAADLELSTTFATAGATILVAPHADGRHLQSSRGSDA